MKKIILTISLVTACSGLISCSSIARSTGGLLQAVGRTIGLNNLTDAPAQPISEEKREEKMVISDKITPDELGE